MITFALSANPDSALRLARFALGAIDGTQQMPTIRPKVTIFSTHYVRDRRGGGHTEVAVMVAVDRAAAKSSSEVTLMELRAFALDVAQAAPPGRRTSAPQTALSTNAPALRRPRPITPADTTDWLTLAYVVEAIEKGGARRLP